MQSYPLAVFSHTLGVRSETFISRHVTKLLPDKTVLVCEEELTDTSEEWGVEGPILNLSKIPPMSLNVRVARKIKGRLGYRQDEYNRKYIKHFLKSNNVKVMLCEYLNHSIPWIDMARELGIRMYAHAHGFDVSVILRDPKWIEKYQKLNQINGVITMNIVTKQRLIDIGIKESLISVIPYGIYLPSRQCVYSSNKHVRCLAVGRMTGKKAPIYLLEAFRRALKSYPDMTLDYIGDGDLMPAMLQFIDAFKMSEKVNLHGSQMNSFVYQLMSQSDIFLQHSITNPVNGDEEGLPVGILEAMGHGLPVVSTYHAGIPESVENGITGYLVPEGDVDSMSKKITDLAENAPKRKAFGIEGRKIIEERFTWDKERERLLRVMDLK